MVSGIWIRARALGTLSSARAGTRRLGAAWKGFWSWRKIRFSRGGAAFTGGAFAIGFAAINTGNNLLYLLLGAMLGFIAVSSWLSEQVIGAISVQRRVPRGVTVGNPLRIQYEVRNERKRIPALALEIGEEALPGRAFVPLLRAGATTLARSENRFARRGIFPLDGITISTSFPFGLFRKTRTVRARAELVVWPRTDRPVRAVIPGGGRNAAGAAAALGPAGARGEYRGLRGYRAGDDPRDIHWRTSARLGTPVVREYEQNLAETQWVCLDTRSEPGDAAEAAVETAAALVALAFRAGKRFAFSGGGYTLEPGQGPGQLERVLDALARVDFRLDGPRVLPPVTPVQCILVTPCRRAGTGFGEVIRTEGAVPGERIPSDLQGRGAHASPSRGQRRSYRQGGRTHRPRATEERGTG
jgi:uncharacterized protein (DUF58 family)